MRVDLRTLQPNPLRDFTVDPIDPAIVAVLQQSIEEDGFWGGIVCRKLTDGTLQIGAGHHRVAAAIAAGVTTADIFVAEDMDDAGMVRVYARENATQRGTTSTALAGTVASALRFVAKAVLTGTSNKFVGGQRAAETVRGQLEAGRDIGAEILLNFLTRTSEEDEARTPYIIPGLNIASMRQQLANLKASGDYARILEEVQAEIEQENREAFAALEAAEREREQQEQERREAQAREEAARAARVAAEAERREAERARKEAEAAQQAAERQRKEAEARERAAQEEAERQRQAEAVKQAEAERLRQVEAAAQAEAEATARAADAQAAEVERQKAEALADLARKREQEAAEQLKQFESLRQTRDTTRKATAKAKEHPRTFDFEGVAQYFQNPYQVQVFREIVTGIGLQDLPVDQQAALAKEVVERSKRENRRELTGQFIRERTMTIWLEARKQVRQQTKEEHEALIQKDLQQRALHYQREFLKYVNLLAESAVKLEELYRTWPAELAFPYVGTFRDAAERTKRTIDALVEHLHHTNQERSHV
jgi:colicin import membrane protein